LLRTTSDITTRWGNVRAWLQGHPPHTNIAVGADLPPVAETGLRIQLPSHSAVKLALISIGDRIGGTAARAFFANAASIAETLDVPPGRSMVPGIPKRPPAA
jgi:hypothetical protein